MDLDEFKENYLNFLLDKLSKENKCVFLLGDINVNINSKSRLRAATFLMAAEN